MRSFSYNTLRVGHTTYKHNLLAKRWVRCCVMLLSGGKELQQLSLWRKPLTPLSKCAGGRGCCTNLAVEVSLPHCLFPWAPKQLSKLSIWSPRKCEGQTPPGRKWPQQKAVSSCYPIPHLGGKKKIPLFAPLEFVGDKTAETYISLLQCFSKETFSKLL